jgi:hypothetical protein
MIGVRLLLIAGGWLALATTMLRWGVGRDWPEPHRAWRELALVLIVALVSLAIKRVAPPKRDVTS